MRSFIILTCMLGVWWLADAAHAKDLQQVKLTTPIQLCLESKQTQCVSTGSIKQLLGYCKFNRSKKAKLLSHIEFAFQFHLLIRTNSGQHNLWLKSKTKWIPDPKAGPVFCSTST